MLWLARGRAEPRLDQERGVVGAAYPKPDPPRATASARQLPAKRARKVVKPGDDAVMGDERVWKRKPRHEVGRGKERGAWLFATPERLIEAEQDGFGRVLGVEPPLEACPRQVIELADAFQTEPLEQERDLRLKAQSLDRKGEKRLPCLLYTSPSPRD